MDTKAQIDRYFSKVWIYILVLVFLVLSACGSQKSGPFTDLHRTRAEKSFDLEEMNASLAQILAWHQTHQTDLPLALHPGVERKAILQGFADLSCQPTEELIELWTWHNGAEQADVPLIWYHDFLSMEDALAAYQELAGNPLLGWHEGWIPIFAFQGEWYFVECYPETRKASPVGYYFIEDRVTYYTFESLTRMLETCAAWFEREALTWDPEEQEMVEDIQLMHKIYKQFNTGTQFPYYIE